MLRHPFVESTKPGQICSDYYALAAESHEAAKAVLTANNGRITPASLPAPLLRKYVLMRAEYVLSATRLRDITKRSQDLPPRALILGLAEEAARAVFISGHLALLDVLPADLMRTLARRWLRVDHGAAELSLIDASTIPGFGDDPTRPDNLPALSALSDDADVYASICKSGQLRSPDDCRWWESDGRHGMERRTSLLQAADAAECILRMPEIVWTTHIPSAGRRSQHYTPQPLGHVSELLQGLTRLQEDVEDIAERLTGDLKRRRGYLLSEFMVLPEKASSNVAETADIMGSHATFPLS